MSWKQCGTVEILRPRVYDLDPDAFRGTSVFVEPGIYPLYRNVDVYAWVMTGRINERLERMGDGLFGLHQGDRPVGLAVQFPSRSMSLAEINDMLADPVMSSRLRIEWSESKDGDEK